MHTNLSTFLSRKGQIVTVGWQRPMKTRGGVFADVEKRVETQARAGVTYDHMKAVVTKRATGELPEVNQGLPWGRWAVFAGQSLFPHVIAHTPKGASGERHYLRFSNLPGAPISVKYFRDGQPISSAEARALTYASEWQGEGETKDVFNVRADYIQFIR